jgi:hypothetical protein
MLLKKFAFIYRIITIKLRGTRDDRPGYTESSSPVMAMFNVKSQISN